MKSVVLHFKNNGSFRAEVDAQILEGDNCSVEFVLNFPEELAAFNKGYEAIFPDGTTASGELSAIKSPLLILDSSMTVKGDARIQFWAASLIGEDTITWRSAVYTYPVGESLKVNQNNAQAHPDIIIIHSTKIANIEDKLDNVDTLDEQLVQQGVQLGIQTHEQATDPHPIYVQKSGHVLTDNNLTNELVALIQGAAQQATTYTKTEVLQLIDDLINGAPEILDTFYEIANALGDDPNFATTIMAAIGLKEDAGVAENIVLSHNFDNAAHEALFAGKADKVDGLVPLAQIPSLVGTTTLASPTHTITVSGLGLTEGNRYKFVFSGVATNAMTPKVVFDGDTTAANYKQSYIRKNDANAYQGSASNILNQLAANPTADTDTLYIEGTISIFGGVARCKFDAFVEEMAAFKTIQTSGMIWQANAAVDSFAITSTNVNFYAGATLKVWRY